MRGVLPIAVVARDWGDQALILALDNAEEGAIVAGPAIYPVRDLAEAVGLINGEKECAPFKIPPVTADVMRSADCEDFAEVRGQDSLNHSFTGPDGEIQTRLTVERRVRNDKSGYAISVQRDDEQINVPTQSDQFLFAAEFLRHLSLQQAWVEEPERAAG